MNKTTLVITQNETVEGAYDSAVKFCEKLIDGHTAHDYFTPLKENRNCDSIFRETLQIDYRDARKELERLTEMGTKRCKEWIDYANNSLWDRDQSLYDVIKNYRLATQPETFHVFDNTKWSNGDPVTDVVYLNKIIKYMTKHYDAPLWVSGFNVHF